MEKIFIEKQQRYPLRGAPTCRRYCYQTLAPVCEMVRDFSEKELRDLGEESLIALIYYWEEKEAKALRAINHTQERINKLHHQPDLARKALHKSYQCLFEQKTIYRRICFEVLEAIFEAKSQALNHIPPLSDLRPLNWFEVSYFTTEPLVLNIAFFEHHIDDEDFWRHYLKMLEENPHEIFHSDENFIKIQSFNIDDYGNPVVTIDLKHRKSLSKHCFKVNDPAIIRLDEFHYFTKHPSVYQMWVNYEIYQRTISS